MLGDMNFLRDLKEYDKDNIPVPIMTKIRKEFITNPDFDPAKVSNASSAAEGLCKWVLSMEIYDRVAKVVAPKKIKLAEAEQELSETMAQLNQKRAELKAVEERLATLKRQFQEVTEKKEKLEFQVIILLFGFINTATSTFSFFLQFIVMPMIFVFHHQIMLQKQPFHNRSTCVVRSWSEQRN